MNVIYCRSVDEALLEGVSLLKRTGFSENSRNGNVIVSSMPVMTVYLHPQRRVLFSPERDANPFFHLFESLWMLAGRNDSAFPAKYAAQMAQYSDDGVTLNGAYGYRWRRYFGYDQLNWAIGELKKNPESRRVVISMWDGAEDPNSATEGSKDVPCNTHLYLRRHVGGHLDMTVMCRSNDIVWGAYGANAVHFSMLQEYLATAIDCYVGTMYQLSNNYHAYSERGDVARLFAEPYTTRRERYDEESVMVSPLGFTYLSQFDEAVQDFVIDPTGERGARQSSFIAAIARPMALAHSAHKSGNTEEGIKMLSNSNVDWHVAGREWLERRLAKKLAKGAQA
jgi:thymidylate synthase